jgi:hypothetical protein
VAEVVSSSSAPTKKPGAFGLTWAGEEKGAAGVEQMGRSAVGRRDWRTYRWSGSGGNGKLTNNPIILLIFF